MQSTAMSVRLESFFGDSDDEEAVENLLANLEGHPDVAREVQQDWLGVLQRHDPEECLDLVQRKAVRVADNGEAAWEWLNDTYEMLEPGLTRLAG